MLSLSESIEQFKQAGTQLIGVFCQKAEPVKEWAEENKVPFTLLIDEQRETAKDYGVYVRLSYDAFNIARPGNFLIDKTGTIRFVYVSSHQWDRCNTDKLIDEAKSID